MRVQHNIMAMNSYRNYSNNVSALSGNLEKLSSGYKINRAGDDAAGLAISEKMRAQITGLNAAQKNVKDGISLVKTAEGAMQEIQDMLNRMDYLATQSANGTYQNEVDRENLQKEVDALKTEINRIADSANFNGIKLLDGTQEGGGVVGGTKRGAVTVDAVKGLSAGTQAAQVSTVTMAAVSVSDNLKGGDTFTIEVQLDDGKSFTFNVQNVSKNGGKFKYNGEDLTATAAASNKITADEMATLVSELLKNKTGDKAFEAGYTASASGSKVELKENGTGSFSAAAIKNVTVSAGQNLYSGTGQITTAGKADYKKLDIATVGSYDASSATDKASDHIVTINGVKFGFAKDAASSKGFDSDVNVLVTAGATPAAADLDKFIAMVNQKAGVNLAKPESGTTIEMIDLGGKSLGSSSGGLKLQIGDTADAFNQMVVSIKSMKVNSLGISGVDISNQAGAASAIQSIKDAINTVSSVRGDLGAIQNRLEHTQKNLSVMAENIQDAESTIRDTDVAEEMMSYVKNNILVQSAQAMLAQANQVPQGVLQLLG